ncbi:c-type cytochrome domain-containing protein [Echinicola sediminis]
MVPNANASTIEEPSRLILALGRFHPLILHLPIGALLLTFFLDIMGRFRKKYPKSTIVYSLGFSSFFAVVACVLGYFLSLEGGYTEEVLDFHFWFGSIAAGLIILLFLLRNLNLKVVDILFLPLFIITIGIISIAGHYGSILTHGSEFLTEHLEEKEPVIPITDIDSLNIFDNVVHRILEDKCIQCHNASKMKGDLSLVSKASLLKGGANGKAIILKNPHESLLYSLSVLPISDERHMPPEGKPQLTKDEIWLLKYWITHSMEIDDKVVSLPKSDSLKNILKDYLVLEKKYIEEASLDAIEEVKKAGFTIRKISPDDGGLWLSLKNKDLPETGLKLLSKISPQIVELDLGNTDLSDDMTKGFDEFSNLTKLHLNNTKIGDETLNHLKSLKQLETLVLHSTGVSGEGLKKFLGSNSPKSIYVWNTKVSAGTIRLLEEEYDININMGASMGLN